MSLRYPNVLSLSVEVLVDVDPDPARVDLDRIPLQGDDPLADNPIRHERVDGSDDVAS